MAQNPSCQTEIPKVVLGVAAHPDDLDYAASGTVASWVHKGAKVYYLILTNGNKGSSDMHTDPKQLVKIRREEQLAAAKILGVTEVFFCDYEDGGLEVSLNVKRNIVRVIRTIRPDTVITMDPGSGHAVRHGAGLYQPS